MGRRIKTPGSRRARPARTRGSSPRLALAHSVDAPNRGAHVYLRPVTGHSRRGPETDFPGDHENGLPRGNGNRLWSSSSRGRRHPPRPPHPETHAKVERTGPAQDRSVARPGGPEKAGLLIQIGTGNSEGLEARHEPLARADPLVPHWESIRHLLAPSLAIGRHRESESRQPDDGEYLADLHRMASCCGEWVQAAFVMGRDLGGSPWRGRGSRPRLEGRAETPTSVRPEPASSSIRERARPGCSARCTWVFSPVRARSTRPVSPPRAPRVSQTMKVAASPLPRPIPASWHSSTGPAFPERGGERSK